VSVIVLLPVLDVVSAVVVVALLSMVVVGVGVSVGLLLGQKKVADKQRTKTILILLRAEILIS